MCHACSFFIADVKLLKINDFLFATKMDNINLFKVTSVLLFYYAVAVLAVTMINTVLIISIRPLQLLNSYLFINELKHAVICKKILKRTNIALELNTSCGHLLPLYLFYNFQSLSQCIFNLNRSAFPWSISCNQSISVFTCDVSNLLLSSVVA